VRIDFKHNFIVTVTCASTEHIYCRNRTYKTYRKSFCRARYRHKVLMKKFSSSYMA